MSSIRPFIEARLNELQREIDADLFLWLSQKKHPGVQFSGSLPLVYWGPYLDELAAKIIDTAFVTARQSAEENNVDPVPAANAACEAANNAVLKTISKMVDFDQKMRGKGFPATVAPKNAHPEIERTKVTAERRRKAEVALLEDSIRSRGLRAMGSGKHGLQSGGDHWYKKPLGIFLLSVVAALFVALCKMTWPNIFK